MSEARIYGNLTVRQRTGFLFGLGPVASMMGLGLIAAVIAIAAVFQNPALAIGVFLVGATTLFFTRSAPNDVSLLTKMKARVMFTWLRRKKRTLYRPAMMRSFQPPGLASSLQLVELPVPSDQVYAAIANPAQKTLTVVFSIAAKGDEALSQFTIDNYVDAWGVFLRDMGQMPDCLAAQAVTETFPDPGVRGRVYLEESLDQNAPELARDIIDVAAQELPAGRLAMRHRLAIVFNQRGRDWETCAGEVAKQIRTILPGLEASGLTPRLMSHADITEFCRRAYNPSDALPIDLARADAQAEFDLDFSEVGPTAAEEQARGFIHGDFASTSYAAYRFPTDGFIEQVLRPILEPNYDLPLKRVCITYRPYERGEARSRIDADHRDAVRAARRTNRGQEDPADQIRLAAVEQSRMEIQAGHGYTRAGIIVTVTNLLDSDQDATDILIDGMGRAASLHMRATNFHHSANFAAGLGIGILLERGGDGALSHVL